MSDSGREFYIVPQTGFRSYSKSTAIARARSAAKRVTDTYTVEVEDSGGRRVFQTRGTKKRKNPATSRTTKRIPAAVGSFMKRLNPSKMKGVSKVRVKKLKGGGVTITPAR